MRPICRAFAAVALAATAATGTIEASTPDDEDWTEIQLEGDARILALSPDGRLVAATPGDRDDRELLCVHDVATGTEQACGDLTEHEIRFAVDSVVWSPDSTMLAFAEAALQRLVDGDIWVMDATTGEITNVTDDGAEGEVPRLGDEAEQPTDPVYVDIVPTWTPNSRLLTFSRSPYVDGEWGGNEIASVELATGDTEVLTTVTTDGPGAVWWAIAWAPDGRRLFYSVDTGDRDDPENGIWELDRDSGEAQQILPVDPDKGPPALIDVAATGTTGLVVYPYIFMRGSGQDADTYELLDLATRELSAIHPAADSSVRAGARLATFSPDGTRLLYGLDDGDGTELFVRELLDGEPEAIAPGLDPRAFGWVRGGAFWADDGTVVVFTTPGTGAVLHLDPGEIADPAPDEPPASTAAAAVPASDVAAGSAVVLTDAVAMRATPSANGQAVLELVPGAELMVVSEPVVMGDEQWVPVVEPATGTIGYIDATLLEPAG